MAGNELKKYEEQIINLVMAWNPERKSFVIRNRMRYLFLIAMEKINEIRFASERNDETQMKLLFEEFKNEYERIISLPEKNGRFHQKTICRNIP